MELFTDSNAIMFLKTLIGKPLLYALKSPDTELYDFGFGNLMITTTRQGKTKRIGTHSIHALCRVKLITSNPRCQSEQYCGDTPREVFEAKIHHLIGLKVLRVALSDKNDLWLDLGDCWIVFITFENGEESWRYFIPSSDSPHLIGSDSWISFY